jgi:hypothetical protein
MKTLLTAIVAVSILAIGAMAFAHGSGGWGGGHMMGPGYGGHMMEQGYGGHMRGWTDKGYAPSQKDKKFFDETAALRKDLHDKRFEYFEAQRNPETKGETIAKLEKEIFALQDQIRKNAPRTVYGGAGGYGYCH